MKIALIHDWLVAIGGAERVLEAVLEIFPGSPIYTMVYRPDNLTGSTIHQAEVHPSSLNRLPWAGRGHRVYFPLMPLAVEQFDLRAFDIVISLSHAVAHGVLTRPDQLHLSYTFSPARFAWHLYQDYLDEGNLRRGLRSWLARPMLHYFRLWDHAAASRVDQFAAISSWIAGAIRRAYHREAGVIYPPVDVERFTPAARRDDVYITVARLVTNKRIDLIVAACKRLGRRLCVIGDGPERKRLERQAGGTIEFLGWQDDASVAKLMGSARAFIHAADEDFGIALLEAQAAGCPVIALGRGAALETVVEGVTGMFFPQPTVESLMGAIEAFEMSEGGFQSFEARRNAERYSTPRFKKEFETFVEQAWTEFQRGQRRR